MNKEMTLKEFIEGVFETNALNAVQCGAKLIELEGIENWLNLMYGIHLDIKVKPARQTEGRFYGKSLIDKINK